MKKIGVVASPEVFDALRDVAPDFDLDVVHLGTQVVELSSALCAGLSGLIIELGDEWSGDDTKLLATLALPIAGLPVSDQNPPEIRDGVVATILWGPSDVADWADTLASSDPGGTKLQPGKVVVVWGPSGAPGRTTVALSVASVLAKARQRVVLIDGDTVSPSIAPMLGLDGETSGLLAGCRIARGTTRDARDILARGVTYTGNQLTFSVLTGLVGRTHHQDVDALAYSSLLDTLTSEGYQVVIDVASPITHEPGDAIGGTRRNGVAITSLERADVLLVVLRAKPVSALRLVREWGSVQHLAPHTNFRILINAVSPHEQQALVETQHVVWEFTGVSDTTALPFAGEVIAKATAERCTVAEIGPKNNFFQALHPVVREFFPAAEPTILQRSKPLTAPPIFAGMFGKLTGKQGKGLL
jgi:MinD-like ATPase involved in chromosome partitioning or flagellar assembly